MLNWRAAVSLPEKGKESHWAHPAVLACPLWVPLFHPPGVQPAPEKLFDSVLPKYPRWFPTFSSPFIFFPHLESPPSSQFDESQFSPSSRHRLCFAAALGGATTPSSYLPRLLLNTGYETKQYLDIFSKGKRPQLLFSDSQLVFWLSSLFLF